MAIAMPFTISGKPLIAMIIDLDQQPAPAYNCPPMEDRVRK